MINNTRFLSSAPMEFLANMVVSIILGSMVVEYV